MRFLTTGVVISVLIFNFSLNAQDKKILADALRMEKRITELGEFGKNEVGGVSRVAFSEADKQGREYIIALMKQAGLEVRIDAAANIIGRRKGKNDALPAIAFGSHIDSVPMGGNYDGEVGVIGALECIELLNKANITTNHPLEVIVFTDEEGGLTGSRAMNGTLTNLELNNMTHSGKTIGDGIRFLGGNPERLQDATRKKTDFKAFLELHIEQGSTLYTTSTQIGVVEGIVGIEWWDVTFEGMANHAGTTPMNGRSDALLAAAKFITLVNETVVNMQGRQVGTVGRIRAEPGAPNVIPGKVVTSLEIRDLSRDKIFEIFNQIKSKAEQVSKELNVAISFRPLSSSIPAITDKRVQEIIARAATELGLTTKHMPSGAGHDAQDMAKLTPTGMIFVPSKDGISHSPAEFTSKEDMANGAAVLLRSILAIDRAKW